MADNGGDRSEKATPRKRQKSRKEGQVANSKEMASAAVLLTGLAIFFFFASWMLTSVKGTMQSLFLLVGQYEINMETLFPLAKMCVTESAKVLAPVMLSVLVAGLTANIAQVGVKFSTKPMMPDLKKINPISGLKKMFSMRSLVELVKSLVKITLVGTIAYKVIAGSFDEMIAVGQLSIHGVFAVLGSIALKLVWYVCLAMVVLAILDLAYQRYDNEKKMKMSKQEVKDEHKNFEGDPKIKSRQRAIQREMAMRRMMADVPQADVILTNPTHVAVAIKYDADKADAPLVIAKGAGFIAQKIRETAKDAHVPVLERPPLARELYRVVEIGKAIPNSLFEAVAEILAYIYNLKGKTAR